MTDLELPDGLYIDLPFEQYVAQRGRLGSTGKGHLHKHGPGFWWASSMNPYYVRAQSADMLFGEALHALLLEGMGAYETRFKIEPDKRSYHDPLFTIPAIKAAFAEASIKIPGSSTFRLEEWAEQAALHLPDRTVWHNVMRDFERSLEIRDPVTGELTGLRKSLSAEDDFRLRAMYEAAMDDHPDNADVRDLLSVGRKFPVLAELSILYTDDEGRGHRARLDKAVPMTTVDLKSLGAWQGRPIEHMVGDTIIREAYDIQCADYQVARRAGFEMILEDEGRLNGGTLEERAHLLAMAAWQIERRNRPNWGWLFFGKPENTGRAPTLFPLLERWGGPYHRSGFRKRARALALYDECMARFGPDRPWSKVMPLHFTSEADSPHITVGHYGFDEEPVDGEAAHFGDGED